MAKMSPIHLFVACFVGAGCGHPGPMSATQPCEATPSGDPIAVSDQSPLGFSAQDVLDMLSGDRTTTAVDVEDGSTFSRTLTFAFASEGSAQLEERTVPDGYDRGMCLVGPTLALNATVSVQATDGWFSGEGPVAISAQGADHEHIWVRLFFDVTAADELAYVAVARNHASCDAADVVVNYVIGDEAVNPWAGNVGNLELETCSGARMLYRLEPQE